MWKQEDACSSVSVKRESACPPKASAPFQAAASMLPHMDVFDEVCNFNLPTLKLPQSTNILTRATFQ